MQMRVLTHSDACFAGTGLGEVARPFARGDARREAEEAVEATSTAPNELPRRKKTSAHWQREYARNQYNCR
jgi:hypothetical protein